MLGLWIVSISLFKDISSISIVASGLSYIGPETVMPLATFLASIIGILLIFWRLIVRTIKKLFSRLRKNNSLDSTQEMQNEPLENGSEEDF